MAAPTPNLGLAQPDDGQQGWGAAIRGNNGILDSLLAKFDSTTLLTESSGVMWLRRIFQAVSYARDPNDRMRVVVENSGIALNAGSQAVGHVSMQLGSQGGIPVWYGGNGAPTSMDAREQQKQAARAAFNQVRNDRWRFT